MKNVYVAPKMDVTKISVISSVLASSFVDEYRKTREEKRAAQRCPFNNKRCRDKQKRFNEWCDMVEYLAKNNIDCTFMIRSQNGCPYGYTVLCADYKQKQRD